MEGFKKYINKNRYTRVIRLAKTPDREDFLDVAKIAGVGIIVVGVVGFFIAFMMGLLPIAG